MSVEFPEPTRPAASRTEVFLRYLDYFRDRLAAKLRELPADELRQSRLPSGWTPLELLKHLTYVERRWLEWGFEGHRVPDPWGDRRDGRWHVAPEETLDQLLAGLAESRRPPSSGSCSTSCRSTPATSATWTSCPSWQAAPRVSK